MGPTMSEIETVSIVIAASSVIIGVLYYLLDIRNQSKMRQTEIETRQANLLIEIYNHYYTTDFLNDENEILFQWKWKDFDDFWQKYGPETNIKAFNKWDSMGTYFKGIGVLVRMNLIDLNLVDELMGTSIRLHWEKSGSIMKEFRKRMWPHAYEWFEYLYNELQKREERLRQSSMKEEQTKL
jgi:hypothetical protein